MIAYLFSKLITMVYGMLYPAYCSYKAVKTKDVKEYVHWMMYWIVFSIFSFFEVFADTFIGCWFPFYYELKILFMIWMLSPTTRGGSILYRRLIHPSLTRHEPEIDAYIAEFKIRTSSFLVQWGSRAFAYVTDFVMHTALRAGAGDYRFAKTMSRTYSYENFDQPDMNRNSHPQGDLSPGSVSDADYPPFADPNQAIARQRKMYAADARYGSMEENLGQFGDMSKPYSMMNLADDSESQPPPKLRSSTRKKKEFGNFSVVTAQDMSMPLVFGWYPPNMTSPLMSSSFPHQDLSQIPLSMHSQGRSGLMFPSTSVQWVESNEDDTDKKVETEVSHQVSVKEGKDVAESDSFFDCESDQESNGLKAQSEVHDGVALKPNVQVVSKTVLQGFEGNDNEATVKKRKSPSKSDEDTQKRNSMSAINKISPSSSTQSKAVKPKVKKSLSNSDLKMTKAPILSSSSFRRVFSLSSPKPVRARRSGSGSRTCSTASLNMDKDKPK